MKKARILLTVALVVALIASIFAITTSAESTLTLNVACEAVGAKTQTTEKDVYRMIVNVSDTEADGGIKDFNLAVSYDADLIQPVRKQGKDANAKYFDLTDFAKTAIGNVFEYGDSAYMLNTIVRTYDDRCAVGVKLNLQAGEDETYIYNYPNGEFFCIFFRLKDGVSLSDFNATTFCVETDPNGDALKNLYGTESQREAGFNVEFGTGEKYVFNKYVSAGNWNETGKLDYAVSYPNSNIAGYEYEVSSTTADLNAGQAVTINGTFTAVDADGNPITANPAPTYTYKVLDAATSAELTDGYTLDGASVTVAPTVDLAGKTSRLIKLAAYNGEKLLATTEAISVEKKINLSGAAVTLSAQELLYNGTAQSVTVTSVVLGEKTLTEGTDYTVNVTSGTNAGTYDVTVTGTGDYTGTAANTYEIKPLEVTVDWSNTTLPYNTLAQKPTAAATGANGYSIPLTVSGEQTNVGADYPATATFANAADANNYILKAGTDETEFSITKVDYTGTALSATKKITYNAGTGSLAIADLTDLLGAKFVGAATETTDANDFVSAADVAESAVTFTTETYASFPGAYEATYTVSVDSQNYNPTTATITVVCQNKKDLADTTATITFEDGSVEYGTENPLQNAELVGSTGAANGKFTYSYNPAVAQPLPVGTYTVTATYEDDVYIGTATATLTVTAKSIAGATVTLTKTELGEYTAAAQTAEVKSVVLDGETLVQDTDYTVSGATATDAGQHTLTVNGKGNYSGTATATYRIDKKSVAVAWTGDSFIYNGKAQAPTAKATGIDEYDIALNVTGAQTNVGTEYTATAALKNEADDKNYELTNTTKTFAITAKALTATIEDIAAVTYNTAPQTPVLVVKDGDKVLVKDTDYTVAYTNNTNAGEATATVTFKGNYSGTASKNFTINKADLTAVATIADIASVTYNAAAQEPVVTVTAFEKTLVKDTDYTVAYTNNTNAGEATATITAVTDGNYTGTLTKNFTIQKATPSVEFSVNTSGEPCAVATFNGNTVDGTVNKIPMAADGYTYFIVNFLPTDSTNFNNVGGDLYYTANGDTIVPLAVDKSAAENAISSSDLQGAAYNKAIAAVNSLEICLDDEMIQSLAEYLAEDAAADRLVVEVVVNGVEVAADGTILSIEYSVYLWNDGAAAELEEAVTVNFPVPNGQPEAYGSLSYYEDGALMPSWTEYYDIETEGDFTYIAASIKDLGTFNLSFTNSKPSDKNAVTVVVNATRGGTVAPSGRFTVTAGTSLTLKIKPNAGYILTNVKVNGVNAKIAYTMFTKNYTLTNIDEDTYVEVTFAPVGGASMAFFNVKTAKYSAGIFSDVNENAWYGLNQQGVIAKVYEMGIMCGDAKGTFRPTGNITLAEAIKMAAVVNNIYNANAFTFNQNVGNNWYDTYVNYAISKGIIKAGEFTNYGAAATRAQMAYIFANALPAYELTAKNDISFEQIPDVNGTGKYDASILALYRAGVLTGDNDGSFRANDKITRAESAAIIAKLAQPAMRATLSL